MVVDGQKAEAYIKQVLEKLNRKYSEKTFRTPFENFINSLSPDYSLQQEITDEGIGTPDFKAFYKNHKVGYIETKDFNATLKLDTEQIKRYVDYENNLLLTNYVKFVLIRKGRTIQTATLFYPEINSKNKSQKLNRKHLDDVLTLISEFFGFPITPIQSAKELAVELAKKAKWLNLLSQEQLELERTLPRDKRGSISEFEIGLKELIGDYEQDINFGEAYAETITYGLFLAKLELGNNKTLDKNTAYQFIPPQIKVIKRIFRNITDPGELPQSLSWVVDDIIDILNLTDLNKFIAEFHVDGEIFRDPFFHFYEDFLSEFNPVRRKKMGVYYTPIPIVKFIVRSTNSILKKEFHQKLGFATENVHTLDPCVGTGTFCVLAIMEGISELKKHKLMGLKKSKIKNHFLKRFFGFEILVSPYIIAHMKIGELLEQDKYELGVDERIPVYLTNTLELHPEEGHELSPFLTVIKNEVHTANEIKTKKPLLVVMGNPPYSSSSFNDKKWIKKKIEDYKEGLNERKLGDLDDDYVKFIRFAQWEIERQGKGVVAFITSNGYLEGITFRKMRENLCKTFDKIYILNLHGNSRIGEHSPDGSKDENPFNIQTGVAIGLFVRNSEKPKKIADVYYFNEYGLRDLKLKFLNKNMVDTVKWKKLDMFDENFWFVPKDHSTYKKYAEFFEVRHIFKEYSSGVETKRDNFVIDFEKKELIDRLTKFANTDERVDVTRRIFGLSSKSDLDVVGAQKFLKSNKYKLSDFVIKYNYRPFDERLLFYKESLVSRTRLPFMNSLLLPNIALNLCRQVRPSHPFNHVFVTNNVTDRILLSNTTSECSFVFPLYIYEKETQLKLGSQKSKTGKKQINFTEEFKTFLKNEYKKDVAPETVMGYIYAILNSCKYKTEFQEALRTDFPRVYFVKSLKKFIKIAELGSELVDLHLLKKKKLNRVGTFEGKGNNSVEKIIYKDDKIFINKNQYFGKISKDLWEFKIGIYPVLNKWLYYRKGRTLSNNDVETFIDIVSNISETIKILTEIDKIDIFKGE